MSEQAENKMDTLPDLDDLLQCPVCYEIPTGQIFQCNEGHHVCGRCKMRLDVCPVCRAFFFGTRNYAMEELISNVRKLRAFKLGGKVTTGSPPVEETPEVKESSSDENESVNENANDDDDDDFSVPTSVVRPPTSCKGLFRCLCCKKNQERLPIGRLLNHIRYYHSPDLIEGRSENAGYVQAWQFPTTPGRMVTAVRVHDMGIFFLIIEVDHDSVHAWLSMAASPWVAQEFSYCLTLSGNDREAIFSDCVWSVRSCEGSLRRRGRCLALSGTDAEALLAPATMNGKVSVRRAPHEQQPHAAQPRAVLRVANRSNAPAEVAHDLEPFLQDLQNDVARLSRAFATLGREANALVRSEAEMRARLEGAPETQDAVTDEEPSPHSEEPPPVENGERHLSRNARRRMRQRLRVAFRENQTTEEGAPAAATANTQAARPAARQAGGGARPNNIQAAGAAARSRPISNRTAPNRVRPRDIQTPNVVSLYGAIARPQSNQVVNNTAGVSSNAVTSANITAVNNNVNPVVSARATDDPANNNAILDENMVSAAATMIRDLFSRASTAPSSAPVSPPTVDGPSQACPSNGNTRNKKKRRQRR